MQTCSSLGLSSNLLQCIIVIVVNPLIKVLLAVAILYFIWGMWKYAKNSDKPEELQTGARHIGYSLIGIFIMISVGGIMWFIQNNLK